MAYQVPQLPELKEFQHLMMRKVKQPQGYLNGRAEPIIDIGTMLALGCIWGLIEHSSMIHLMVE